MNLSLVSIISTDKLELPGLFYAPDKKTYKVAVWLHGMGETGSFYNPQRINQLAKALTDKNIALLAFNNRGAYNSKKIRIIDETLPDEDRGYTGGTHFEKIADCVYDIDGAVNYVKDLGYKELYLIGHSTGANKICAYHARTNKSPFSKYVLAGPGDDSGLFFNELGKKKFREALRYAKKFAIQNSLKIMPKYTGMYPFSTKSAADILDPDGDYNTFPFYEASSKRLGKKQLFAEYATLDIPTLVIFGSEDEYAYTAGNAENALKLFKKYAYKPASKSFDYQTVRGADHSFHNYESEFAERVAKWLAS